MQHFTSTYKQLYKPWPDGQNGKIACPGIGLKQKIPWWLGMVESSGVAKWNAREEGMTTCWGRENEKYKEITISFRCILLSERTTTSHWSVADGEHEPGYNRRRLASILYQLTPRCNNTSNSTLNAFPFHSSTFPVGPCTPSTFAFSFCFPHVLTSEMSSVKNPGLRSWRLLRGRCVACSPGLCVACPPLCWRWTHPSIYPFIYLPI